jgi:TPR repeat protein
MFTQNSLKILATDKVAFNATKIAAADPNHTDYLVSTLKLGLCQIYAIGIEHNIVEGFDKVCDVYFAGKKYAHAALIFLNSKKTKELHNINDAFKHYSLQEPKTAKIQSILGFLYSNGLGVTQNIETAIEWYTTAAKQEFAPAQYHLALYYEQTQGVTQKLETAIEYYTAATNQEYAPAQHNLGHCYEYGIGVNKNEITAADLYAKSAKQEYAPGQLSLGVCYALGAGVLQSREDAIKHYKNANEQGYKPAQTILQMLEPISTKDQKRKTTAETSHNNKFKKH